MKYRATAFVVLEVILEFEEIGVDEAYRTARFILNHQARSGQLDISNVEEIDVRSVREIN